MWTRRADITVRVGKIGRAWRMEHDELEPSDSRHQLCAGRRRHVIPRRGRGFHGNFNMYLYGNGALDLHRCLLLMIAVYFSLFLRFSSILWA